MFAQHLRKLVFADRFSFVSQAYKRYETWYKIIIIQIHIRNYVKGSKLSHFFLLIWCLNLYRQKKRGSTFLDIMWVKDVVYLIVRTRVNDKSKNMRLIFKRQEFFAGIVNFSASSSCMMMIKEWKENSCFKYFFYNERFCVSGLILGRMY